MSRLRADLLLVRRGLFDSRAKAQAAIAAGRVTHDGAPVRSSAELLSLEAVIEAGLAHPYVSRGGLKLAAALDAFGFDPAGRICLDVGASTGGFTDVLLRRGGARVYAVDVGHGQLHPSLRGRVELVVVEGTDIRELDGAQLRPPPTLVVADLSFISLRLVLPAMLALAEPQMELIALIKPQFEAGRAAVRKGVVRDEAIHTRVCAEIGSLVEANGMRVIGLLPSPILGGSGNREFLIGAVRD